MFTQSDTVVRLGCGTGWNSPWLKRNVTSTGRSVDLTFQMPFAGGLAWRGEFGMGQCQCNEV